MAFVNIQEIARLAETPDDRPDDAGSPAHGGAPRFQALSSQPIETEVRRVAGSVGGLQNDGLEQRLLLYGKAAILRRSN